MSVFALNLPTYLTVQIQQIVGYGSDHFITWADKRDWHDWLQVSVHYTNRYYLSVQFPLPEPSYKRQMDRLFQQPGWNQVQAGDRDCPVYYLAHSDTLEELVSKAERIGLLCASAMAILWEAQSVEEVALLGARGPNIPLPKREKKVAISAKIA